MTNSSRYRKHIAVATGTRADWGLLKPVADELCRLGAEVSILATNMHLDDRYGHTVDEIREDGFEPVELETEGETPSEVTASTLNVFAHWLDANVPDAVVILGDRFEMLGVASAALLTGIPVVHIAGGTVSEGAFDDSIRNAISKMAVLHFPETDLCRQRLLQMGENPDNVFTAGATGVWNTLHTTLMSEDDLEKDLGIKFSSKTLMATLHPATLADITPEKQMNQFLTALSELMASDDEVKVILTYPNNDCSTPQVIDDMTAFADKWGGRVALRKSLGRIRYLSALRHCAAVVGNSSSGIVEIPSSGIPTLDCGQRQKGREHGPSVIHCGVSADEIEEGLHKVLSPEIKAIAALKENPYQREDTPQLIAAKIMAKDFSRYPSKKFHPFTNSK